MRREGMAAWVKTAHELPVALPSMSAVLRPPDPTDSAKNELTILLASLVVTLSAEIASA